MLESVDVSVIIVNFNTKSLLRNCLQSIFDKTFDIKFEVIVSDNGSTDGSVEMVKQEFSQVRVLENGANLGFGTANNRGFDVAKGKYIFYLNSDTLLLNNAIKLFYDYWQTHKFENLGALGCNLVDANGILIDSYGMFPTVSSLVKKEIHHLLAFYVKNIMKFFKIDFSKLRPTPIYKHMNGEVEYVTGADLFVKKNDSAKFDENFFLYYEETDMQWRMSKKKLKRLVIDGPSIMHLVRGGVKKIDDVVNYGTFSIIQVQISKVRFAKKNLSRAVALFLKVIISLHWVSPYIFKNTYKYFKSLWRV